VVLGEVLDRVVLGEVLDRVVLGEVLDRVVLGEVLDGVVLGEVLDGVVLGEVLDGQSVEKMGFEQNGNCKLVARSISIYHSSGDSYSILYHPGVKQWAAVPQPTSIYKITRGYTFGQQQGADLSMVHQYCYVVSVFLVI
jgi:hypothetical protein